MWIVIVVVVVALIVLVLAVWPLLSRLAGLQRAALRLQKRQEDALRLQQGAVALEHTVAGLQQRAERMQDRLTVIKAGHGDRDEARAFLDR
jgi:Tfp pilus assembly protein PilN